MKTELENHQWQALLKHLSHVFASIPFNHLLGLKLEQLSTQQATVNFPLKKELVGNFLHGILHGGVISTVFDTVGGIVVMAKAAEAHANASPEELAKILGKCSTIDLQINYLRPGKGEFFTATSTLVKGGSRISFARMELHNQDGTLIATGSGTYALS